MRNAIHTLIILFTSSLLSVVSSVAHSTDDHPQSSSAAWQALRSGEALILMRHALAPGYGDPDEFMLDRCSTQRNLSNEGRAQAVAIGNVLRANGVVEATILSSQWCRCMETAKLLNLGRPQPAPMLNSFFQDRSSEQAQTQSLRESLRLWLSHGGEVRVLVTHQVNINSLTDQFTGSGDMLIVTLENDVPVVLAKVSTH